MEISCDVMLSGYERDMMALLLLFLSSHLPISLPAVTEDEMIIKWWYGSKHNTRIRDQDSFPFVFLSHVCLFLSLNLSHASYFLWYSARDLLASCLVLLLLSSPSLTSSYPSFPHHPEEQQISFCFLSISHPMFNHVDHPYHRVSWSSCSFFIAALYFIPMIHIMIRRWNTREEEVGDNSHLLLLLVSNSGNSWLIFSSSSEKYHCHHLLS